MNALLQVDNLSVRYRTAESEVTAVDQVSFRLAQGEILGLVGESGCGKSTLALALLGLLDEKARVHGEAIIAGKKLPLEDTGAGLSWREVRGKLISYVPQDPLTGLNPVLRAGLQVEEAVWAHNNISAAGARSLALSLIRKVGLPAPERAYASFPHQLSGGQRQRVLLAMALSQRPQVLVADEPTTALDVTTQAQILREIVLLASEAGTSVLFISHDLGVVAGLAHRMAVMYAGRLVETSPVSSIFQSPAHPYTRALIASAPRLGRNGRLAAVPGQPPSLQDLPPGCAFHPRCPAVVAKCRRVVPPLFYYDACRAVACHCFAGAADKTAAYRA